MPDGGYNTCKECVHSFMHQVSVILKGFIRGLRIILRVKNGNKLMFKFSRDVYQITVQHRRSNFSDGYRGLRVTIF